MSVVMMFITRVVGPVTIYKKGDDHNQTGMNPTIDMGLLNYIQSFTNMRIKVKVKTEGEFCGMTLTQEGLFPNIYRRLQKISGCQWRSYEHFCEYQKSLRDYLKHIQMLGTQKVLTASALLMNSTIHEMTEVLYCIDSWSHIDKAQWESVVQKFSTPVLMPIQEDNHIVLQEVAFRPFIEEQNDQNLLKEIESGKSFMQQLQRKRSLRRELTQLQQNDRKHKLGRKYGLRNEYMGGTPSKTNIGELRYQHLANPNVPAKANAHLAAKIAVKPKPKSSTFGVFHFLYNIWKSPKEEVIENSPVNYSVIDPTHERRYAYSVENAKREALAKILPKSAVD
jgi:hypothetical protein